MALLTVERGTPSLESTTDITDEEWENNSGTASSFEGFVTTKTFAMCLPPRPWTQVTRGDPSHIQFLLRGLVPMMRPADTLRMCVELERNSESKHRYLVIATAQGVQDTEEAVLLGTEMHDKEVSIGLVFPIWGNTVIRLHGDGGFLVKTGERHHVFKTVSVQSMWTALQSLYKLVEVAMVNNYYTRGLSHTWIGWYTQQLTTSRISLSEWNKTEDITYTFGSEAFMNQRESVALQQILNKKLREIMLHVDLEDVSSKQLRQQLEADMDMDLKEYRSFIDETIMLIFGQMEQPSQIKDYLYLGSEWNAANLDELKSIGVGYILNCTREIDNFFPDIFKYKNIRVYDKEESDLLRSWEHTYRFIKQAKVTNSKVLVHCKMGISRSAATVMAFIMKEYQMSFVEAKSYVKEKRACVNPNGGFIEQLKSYEGILKARNNPIWGVKAVTKIRHQRSMSDPDIMQSFGSQQRSSLLQPPHFGPKDMGSTPNLLSEQDNDVISQSLPAQSEKFRIGLDRSVSSPQCVQSAKDYHIRTFLARLHKDDDDQGINLNNNSESTSTYSSPLSLTPPDVESLLKQTLTRVDMESDPEDCEIPDPMKAENTPEVPMSSDRRNSDPSSDIQKVLENDAFLHGKRASVSVEITITVSGDELDQGMPFEDPQGSSDDEETTGEWSPMDQPEKASKVSTGVPQSMSLPEGLNAEVTLREKKSKSGRIKKQHRRSRSDLPMTEHIIVEVDERGRDDSCMLIMEPQIESVKERVMEMEKRTLEQSQPKWGSRILSAPSLELFSSSEPIQMPQRPTSTASDHDSDEIHLSFSVSPEREICSTLHQSTNLDSDSPSSLPPVNEPISQDTDHTNTTDSSHSETKSSRWQPGHQRSQSNIENASVKAIISSIEEKAQNENKTGKKGRHSNKKRKIEKSGSGNNQWNEDRPSSLILSSHQLGIASVVKRTQSLCTLPSAESKIQKVNIHNSINHNFPGPIPEASGNLTDDPVSDEGEASNVQRLTLKFEERKVRICPQIRHSFTSSTSSSRLSLYDSKVDISEPDQMCP